MNKPQKDIILVFAHPDDEILWASSMALEAKKIITCFSGNPDNTELTSYRKKAIQSYPLENFINLGVNETGVFKSSDWRHPVDTKHGVLCALNYQSYENAFETIKSRLLPFLSNGQTVITHNPWGEYGHEEHVLVHKVVRDISRELNLNILVPGCVSNRSLYLMQNHIGEISDKYFLKEPDYKLSAKVKNFYQDFNCWTMPDDYEWPAFEIFYEVVNDDNLKGRLHMKPTVPMNIIVFKGLEISYKDILRYLYYKIHFITNSWIKKFT